MILLAASLVSGKLVTWLLGGAVVGALLIGIVAFVWVLSRKRPKKRIYNHRALFESLCRAHGLDRKSCRLLREVAQYHGLAHPARLFVERKWLFPFRLSPELRARSAELTAIRRQLFFAPKEQSR